jgi:hypothetical protein
VRLRTVALAALLVASGCGSAHHSSRGHANSGTLQALFDRPGENVALVNGASDFATGVVRLPFVVLTHTARAVYRPEARVWVARSLAAKPFEETRARLEPIGVPSESQPAFGGVTKIYVAELRISQPGHYWALAEPVGGKPIQGVTIMNVKARSSSPPLGSRAPDSRTPTIASAHGRLRLLTTRVPPDRALLRYSVAASLAAHVPFVLTFATPEFCTSRTCGPVVDVVDQVRRRFARSGIRFIHVEVYRDNKPALGYNRWMRQWNLLTEPWTFVVGRDGRIKAKFEGPLSAGELTAAVRRYLA